jgi:hypothetical protein
MNKAISSYDGTILDDFTESNRTGRFRHQAYGYDPFGTPKRKVMGYYVTAPGGGVEHPPDGKVVGLVSLVPFTRRNNSLNNLKKNTVSLLYSLH